MMTEEQITDRLIAAHSAYVAKTGKQPYLAPKLLMYASVNSPITAWMSGNSYTDNDYTGKGKTFGEALDNLDAAISAIPSAEEIARNNAAKAVADAIEKCRAAGYDADFINPLMETAKRISENALTHEAAE